MVSDKVLKTYSTVSSVVKALWRKKLHSLFFSAAHLDSSVEILSGHLGIEVTIRLFDITLALIIGEMMTDSTQMNSL